MIVIEQQNNEWNIPFVQIEVSDQSGRIHGISKTF